MLKDRYSVTKYNFCIIVVTGFYFVKAENGISRMMLHSLHYLIVNAPNQSFSALIRNNPFHLTGPLCNLKEVRENLVFCIVFQKWKGLSTFDLLQGRRKVIAEQTILPQLPNGKINRGRTFLYSLWKSFHLMPWW